MTERQWATCIECGWTGLIEMDITGCPSCGHMGSINMSTHKIWEPIKRTDAMRILHKITEAGWKK